MLFILKDQLAYGRSVIYLVSPRAIKTWLGIPSLTRGQVVKLILKNIIKTNAYRNAGAASRVEYNST
jgi:hypothetical protein